MAGERFWGEGWKKGSIIHEFNFSLRLAIIYHRDLEIHSNRRRTLFWGGILFSIVLHQLVGKGRFEKNREREQMFLVFHFAGGVGSFIANGSCSVLRKLKI